MLIKRDIDYIVVSAGSVEDLNVLVTQKINEGYEVQGSMTISNDGQLYQTMVKREFYQKDKIVDIIILSDNDLVKFNSSVQKYINQGYQPENLMEVNMDKSFLSDGMMYSTCLVKRESDIEN